MFLITRPPETAVQYGTSDMDWAKSIYKWAGLHICVFNVQLKQPEVWKDFILLLKWAFLIKIRYLNLYDKRDQNDTLYSINHILSISILWNI